MDKNQLMEKLVSENHIKSVAVERAFMKVKREAFIPDDQKGMTYYDIPLSIPAGQTISAPSMIAEMLELLELKPGVKVLEIGTGSGYNAALLAEIVGQENVITIERLPELVEFSRQNLKKAGYGKVRVIEGDGSLGYAKSAPYDRILVTAASPKISDYWVDQLKPMGVIVAPVGGRHFYQELVLARKSSDGKQMNELEKGGCVFVPLIGKEGWPDF
jgi:protein-L-isoaspartate(D-aspartate) O-methyltransferase